MTPSQTHEALDILLQADQSPYIHGPTGIGKSTVVRDFAKNPDGRNFHKGKELQFRDVRASQLDPVDARGVPVADHENLMTHWFAPDFLPRDGHGIFFLDELNRANQDTQSAFYQLILDHQLGDYQLPPGWRIVAAGNREIDGCMVQPMSRALKNRFIHLEMESNIDDWNAWAFRNGLNEKVIAFMKARPSMLDEAFSGTRKENKKHQDVIRNSNAFATPRSWEFAARILDVAVERGHKVTDCHSILCGTIGEGVAGEFVAYCDVYLDLPDIDMLIAHPERFKAEEDPSRLYALCTGFAVRAKKSNFENICKLIDKVPPEYQVWTIDDCLARNKKEIATHKSYLKWVQKNIEYVAGN